MNYIIPFIFACITQLVYERTRAHRDSWRYIRQYLLTIDRILYNIKYTVLWLFQ